VIYKDVKMRTNRRFLSLIIILAVVALIVALLAIFVLYRAALNQHRAHLESIVQTQGYLLAAVARFDAEHSQTDHPEGSHAATFGQLQAALEGYSGIGETGEFTVAKLEGDMIRYLLRQRMGDIDDPKSISLNSTLAEPMRRALSGESGTIIALDYEGKRVLAGYQPVDLLELGLVVKVDMAEINAPFILASGISLGVAIIVIALGAYTFFRISDPLVRQLEQSHEVLEELVQERTLELQIERSQFRDLYVDAPVAYFSVNKKGNIEQVNKTGSQMFGMRGAEIIGRPVFDLYAETPRGKQRAKEVFECFLGGEQVLEEELEYQRADGSIFHGSLTVRTLCDESGEIIRSRSTVIDITARKKAEQDLKYTNQFRALLTRLSANFIDIPIDEIDSAIQQTLQEVGRFVQARHFSINLYSKDKTHFNRVYEWVSPGVMGTISRFQNSPINGLGWIEEGALRGENFILSDRAELSDQDQGFQSILELIGAESALGIPLKSKDNVIGFLSIYLSTPGMTTAKDTIELLQVVGRIFVNALGRKQTQTMLSKSHRELSLFQDINNAVLQQFSMDKLIKKIMEMFAELLETKDMMFYLYDVENHRLINQGVHISGKVRERIEKLAKIDVRDVAPILAKGHRFKQAVETGQSFIVSDQNEIAALFAEFTDRKVLKKFIKPVMKILNVKNTGGIPLKTSDEVLGLITFNTEHPMSKADLQQLDRAGSQVAMAISRVMAEQALSQQEERYRTIFKSAAVSIWEEDFSQVKASLNALEARGVRDFRVYLDDHPEFIQQASQMIKVVDVNSATLKLFGAKSKDELLGPLDKIVVPKSMEILKEEIVAIAEGRTYFEGETFNRTLQGELLNVFVTMTIPSDPNRMNSILVSLMDITERVQAQQELNDLNFDLECRIAERTNDLERANSLIASLGEISKEVGAIREVDQIMAVVSSSLRALGFESWFGIVDEDDQAIVVQRTSVKGEGLAKAEKLVNLRSVNLRLPKDRWPIYEQVIEEGHSIYSTDMLPNMRALVPGIPEKLLLQALRLVKITSATRALYIPLKISNRVMGVFRVWSEELQEHDLYAFNIFAGQISGAIENAQHHQELEHTVAERTEELQITNVQLETEISERRRAEERFRTLIEFAPDGIALMDGNRVFQYLSPGVERILGYDQDEAHHLDPLKLTHPDDVAELTNSIRSLRNEPWNLITTQYRFRHRNGSWRLLESTISNLLAEPSVNAFVFNFRDITEQHEAEHRFRSLLDSAPDAMIIVNEAGEITLINDQTEKVFGYKRNELIDKPIERLIPHRFHTAHPGHRQGYLGDAHLRPMGEGLDLFAQHADGNEIPVEISLSPIETAQGTLVIAAVRDITSRKKAQQQIVELAAFPTENPFPILKSDAEGNISYINPAGEEFLTENNVDSTTTILPEDHRENVITCLESGQRCGPIEVKIGDSILSWTYHPVQDAGFVHIYASDVTEQKKAEAIIREREEQLNLFFTQSMDGFFFMMLDEPVRWDDDVDKDEILDYVFEHQRITRINKAMVDQYGGETEDFIGMTPVDFFEHDIEQGKTVWRKFFDNGRMHNETNERRFDGSQMFVEGDFICLYDDQGRIRGHFGVQRDVTARKLAEAKLEAHRDNLVELVEERTKELQASETRFRAVVEDQTEYINRIDPDGTLLFANERYSQLFGKSPEDIQGKSIYEIVSEKGAKHIQEKIKKIEPDQPTIIDEYFSEVENRGGIWFQWTDRGIFNQDGDLIAIQAVGRDITAQKESEEALKLSEQRAQLLKDIATSANAADNPSDALQQVVDQVAKYTRWPIGHVYDLADDGSGDLVSTEIWYLADTKKHRNIKEITQATRFSPGAGMIGKVLASKKAAWIEDVSQVDFFQLTQYAQDIDVHGAFALPVIVNDQVAAVLEFFSTEAEPFDESLIDLMDQIGLQIGVAIERKLAGEALQQSETKFRAIVQDQTEFLVRYLPDTTRTFVNESYARHLNRPIDELIGTRIIDEIPEIDKQRVTAKLVSMTPKDPVAREEYHNKTPQGEDLWEAWTDRGLFDENGDLVEVQAVGRDITQRKQFEHDLRIARDAAEAANRAKTQFLANMSHELRTPMNSILGFAELLDDQVFGELNEKQSRYTSNIRVSGKHLLTLINEILDLAKIEAGHVELEISDTNLENLIMSGIDNTRSLGDQKELVLTMDLDRPLPVIQADPIRINQVLINLLSNAIKFTPQNGRVEVSAFQEDHRVMISVHDTGIGIRPEDQERIFEKFEQVSSDYGHHQEGTGLGLALTKQLVELHGGRIWVESAGEGQGSTFCVELPLSHHP